VSADPYLYKILLRETVDAGPLSPVRGAQLILQPAIQQWANVYLTAVTPSGSFAKGTANRSGTDIDLFISLRADTKETLKEIHDTLFTKLAAAGYSPKRQNVSLGVTVGSYRVDLVPGKRQDLFGNDHSLYRRKADTWTKTNVTTHINHVRAAGRANEIRTLKLWRDQKKLDFPSFYLELTAIAALSGTLAGLTGTLSSKVWAVLLYLRDQFSNARVVDPANTNNIISDDLTLVERGRISAAAGQALKARDWTEIVV
jgi:nucleotidyltransferase-like protein